jgi:hypothetical protein
MKEFVAAAKRADRSMGPAMRRLLNNAVGYIVTYAKPKIPHKTGRAARSVKARSTQTRGRVVEGGRTAPHTPWLDFGGRVGPSRSISRPFQKRGRYIYPGLDAHEADIKADISSAISQVAEDAGMVVSSGG